MFLIAYFMFHIRINYLFSSNFIIHEWFLRSRSFSAITVDFSDHSWFLQSRGIFMRCWSCLFLWSFRFLEFTIVLLQVSMILMIFVIVLRLVSEPYDFHVFAMFWCLVPLTDITDFWRAHRLRRLWFFRFLAIAQIF